MDSFSLIIIGVCMYVCKYIKCSLIYLFIVAYVYVLGMSIGIVITI